MTTRADMNPAGDVRRRALNTIASKLRDMPRQFSELNRYADQVEFRDPDSNCLFRVVVEPIDDEFCAHGVREAAGDFCPECNAEYKRARAEQEGGEPC